MNRNQSRSTFGIHSHGEWAVHDDVSWSTRVLSKNLHWPLRKEIAQCLRRNKWFPDAVEEIFHPNDDEWDKLRVWWVFFPGLSLLIGIHGEKKFGRKSFLFSSTSLWHQQKKWWKRLAEWMTSHKSPLAAQVFHCDPGVPAKIIKLRLGGKRINATWMFCGLQGSKVRRLRAEQKKTF